MERICNVCKSLTPFYVQCSEERYDKTTNKHHYKERCDHYMCVQCVLSHESCCNKDMIYPHYCWHKLTEFDNYDLSGIINELELSLPEKYKIIKDFTYYNTNLSKLPEQKEQSKLIISFVKECCLFDTLVKDIVKSSIEEGLITDEQINRIKYFSLFKLKNALSDVDCHIGDNEEEIEHFLRHLEYKNRVYEDYEGIKLLFYMLISLSEEEFDRISEKIDYRWIDAPHKTIGYIIATYTVSNSNNKILDTYKEIYGSALSGDKNEPKILTKETILKFMNEQDISDSDFFSKAFLTEEFIEYFLNSFGRDIKITKFSIIYCLLNFLDENYKKINIKK